jgi:transposase
MTWLESERSAIAKGELVVLFEDECHLLWGDVCGYGWGKTSERLEIPMTNERKKQTYYGVVNLQSQECLIQLYDKGNSESTIAFLEYLQSHYPQTRIALLWDGASYHRSQEIQAYLASLNQGLAEGQWRITCVRFAPNAPQQNPIEDIWLQAKRFVREYHQLCTSFRIVKYLFEFVTHQQVFHFPKLFTYGCFS